MHKLAIFVEGYTEAVFVERLVVEIAGVHNVVIEQRKIRGGTRVPRRVSVVTAASQLYDEQFYVLIFDCGGDNAVATRVREEHKNLTASGYNKIIGMRDVRPQYSFAEIAKLEAGIKKYIDTSLIPVEFVLATMEIEAWFLAEHNHFSKVDSALTVELIRTALGFDPVNDDLQRRPTPADDLDKCYTLVGKSYAKGNAADTVNLLDYEYIYFELANKIIYLNQLKLSIDQFLTPAVTDQ